MAIFGKGISYFQYCFTICKATSAERVQLYNKNKLTENTFDCRYFEFVTPRKAKFDKHDEESSIEEEIPTIGNIEGWLRKDRVEKAMEMRKDLMDLMKGYSHDHLDLIKILSELFSPWEDPERVIFPFAFRKFTSEIMADVDRAKLLDYCQFTYFFMHFSFL